MCAGEFRNWCLRCRCMLLLVYELYYYVVINDVRHRSYRIVLPVTKFGGILWAHWISTNLEATMSSIFLVLWNVSRFQFLRSDYIFLVLSKYSSPTYWPIATASHIPCYVLRNSRQQHRLEILSEFVILQEYSFIVLECLFLLCSPMFID